MPGANGSSPDFVIFLLIFAVGACLAACANWCADRLGALPKYRSPWRKAPKNFQGAFPQRKWFDYLPVVGWLAMSRLANQTPGAQSNQRGRKDRQTQPVFDLPGLESPAFWIRPFLTELCFALLVAWRFFALRAVSSDVALGSWLVETAFLWILLVSALIDLDDFIIPDAVMIPGALVGLIAAASFPQFVSLPETRFPLDLSGETVAPTFLLWIEALTKSHGVGLSLKIMATLWTFWNFALLDRRFYPRLGLRRATAIFFRRLKRSRLTWSVVALWSLGLFGAYALGVRCAASGSFERLDSLALALIGMTSGVVAVWLVRIVGGSALGVEAMGFGDVILAGVIGSFLGWQGFLAVFFLAPFFGLVFGLLKRLVSSEREIPYGPFLALASLAVIIFREQIFEFMRPVLDDVVFLGILIAIGLVLLVVMLLGVRALKSLSRD